MLSATGHVLESGGAGEVGLAERSVAEEIAVVELAQPRVEAADTVLVGELRGEIGPCEPGEQRLYADARQQPAQRAA